MKYLTIETMANYCVLIGLIYSGSNSIGLMWWLLAREVKRMRGDISRNMAWEVMPDLYFYREEVRGEVRERDNRLCSICREKCLSVICFAFQLLPQLFLIRY